MTTQLTAAPAAPHSVSIDIAAILRMLADCAETNCTSEGLHFLQKLRDQLTVVGKDFAYVSDLVEATAEGRVRLCKKYEGKVCGNCTHYLRFSGIKEGFSGSDNAYATGVCELHVTRHAACSSTSLPKRFTNTSRACRKFTPRGDDPIRYCKEALPCSSMK